MITGGWAAGELLRFRFKRWVLHLKQAKLRTRNPERLEQLRQGGQGPMVVDPLLHHILSDERLTHGLGDAEARILVEWLVEQAEGLMEQLNEKEAAAAVNWLCRRGRALARFVRLWCLERAHGPAGQLAAAEQFSWPLPPADVDPCELMQTIVSWEGDQFWQRRRTMAA